MTKYGGAIMDAATHSVYKSFICHGCGNELPATSLAVANINGEYSTYACAKCICPECHGRKLDCQECNGQGYVVECDECDGTGYQPDCPQAGYACICCRGRGYQAPEVKGVMQ
jgi:RecJ-like exonuclease